jgi:hypothetical protein
MTPPQTFYPCPRCGHYAAVAPDTLCAGCQADHVRGYEALTLTGRCANGAEGGHGILYHAVPMVGSDMIHGDHWGKALCGAEPGRRSAGWSECKGREVTCPRCLKKLAGGGK